MTFWYDEDNDLLEGNRLGAFTEVDDENVTVDVGAIMAEGRGVAKLREIRDAVDHAVQAHSEEGGE